MFSRACVKNSIHRGVGVLPLSPGGGSGSGLGDVYLWVQGCTPPGRHPSQADTPPGQTHPLRQAPSPLGRHPKADTPTPSPSRWPLQRTVRILLVCILVAIFISKYLCPQYLVLTWFSVNSRKSKYARCDYHEHFGRFRHLCSKRSDIKSNVTSCSGRKPMRMQRFSELYRVTPSVDPELSCHSDRCSCHL